MTAPLNVHDYELLAREGAAANAWDYPHGGAREETTLGANRAAFERWELRRRVSGETLSRPSKLRVTLARPCG